MDGGKNATMKEGRNEGRKEELQKTEDGLKRATNDAIKNNLIT